MLFIRVRAEQRRDRRPVLERGTRLMLRQANRTVPKVLSIALTKFDLRIRTTRTKSVVTCNPYLVKCLSLTHVVGSQLPHEAKEAKQGVGLLLLGLR